MYPNPACFLWTEKTGSTQHRERPGDKETRCPTSSMEFSVPFPAQGGCILSYLASLWRNFQLKQPLLGLKCAPTEASCLRCSAIPTAIAVVSTKRALGRASGVFPDFLSPSPCPGPSHYKAPQVSNGMLAMGVHCRSLCVRALAAPLGLGMGELERRGSGFTQSDPSDTRDWSHSSESCSLPVHTVYQTSPFCWGPCTTTAFSLCSAALRTPASVELPPCSASCVELQGAQAGTGLMERPVKL